MQSLGAILGTIGFFLGLFNVFWSMWSYWYQRTERINAYVEPYIGRSLNSRLFSVYLYNVGRTPVYIKAVELVHRSSQEKRPYPLCAEGPTDGALQIGEGRRYVLARLSEEEVEELSNAAENQLWLSIRSPAREIFHLKAKDFRPLLESVVKKTRANVLS